MVRRRLRISQEVTTASKVGRARRVIPILTVEYGPEGILGRRGEYFSLHASIFMAFSLRHSAECVTVYVISLVVNTGTAD